MHLRADHLAGQASDAERGIGKDDPLRELRLGGGGPAREAEPADRLERDERHDGGRSAKEIPA